MGCFIISATLDEDYIYVYLLVMHYYCPHPDSAEVTELLVLNYFEHVKADLIRAPF
jgi:hypothetical protein